MNTRGLSASSDTHEPGPLDEYRCLLLVRRVGESRAGGRHERRLHLLRRPRRMALGQERRNARDVRRQKLVPSRTAKWSPANSGRVDERIWAPGAVTSGLSACPKRVKPDEVKLVGTPAHVVGTSRMSFEEAQRSRRPGRSGSRADARPVEVGNRAARERADESERRVSWPVLRDDDPRRSRGSGLGTLLAVGAAATGRRARSRRSTSPVGRRCRTAPAGWRSGLVSTSRWSIEVHEGGTASVGTKGILGSPLGRDDLQGRSEHVGVRDRPDTDRIGSGGG